MFLLSAVIDGFFMNFGGEFTRKVMLWLPKTKTYQELIDDGTYVFKDGKLVGRLDMETAKFKEMKDTKSHLEPFMIYFARFFFLGSSLIGLLFMVMIIMSIIVFFFLSLSRDPN